LTGQSGGEEVESSRNKWTARIVTDAHKTHRSLFFWRKEDVGPEDRDGIGYSSRRAGFGFDWLANVIAKRETGKVRGVIGADDGSYNQGKFVNSSVHKDIFRESVYMTKLMTTTQTVFMHYSAAIEMSKSSLKSIIQGLLPCNGWQNLSGGEVPIELQIDRGLVQEPFDLSKFDLSVLLLQVRITIEETLNYVSAATLGKEDDWTRLDPAGEEAQFLDPPPFGRYVPENWTYRKIVQHLLALRTLMESITEGLGGVAVRARNREEWAKFKIKVGDLMNEFGARVTHPMRPGEEFNRFELDEANMTVFILYVNGVLSGWLFTSEWDGMINAGQLETAKRFLIDAGFAHDGMVSYNCTGDDIRLRFRNQGWAMAFFCAYKLFGFVVHPKKFWISYERDEYLRQVTEAGGAGKYIAGSHGYVWRGMVSVQERNPLAKPEARGLLTCSENIAIWNALISKMSPVTDGDWMEESVYAALTACATDIAKSTKTHLHTVVGWMISPSVRGGGGIARGVGLLEGCNWPVGLVDPERLETWSLTPGTQDVDIKFNTEDVHGLDRELDFWRLKGLDMPLDYALHQLRANFGMPGYKTKAFGEFGRTLVPDVIFPTLSGIKEGFLRGRPNPASPATLSEAALNEATGRGPGRARGLRLVDGDEVVTWPVRPRFWEVDDYRPFADRGAMLSRHRYELDEAASETENTVVLINAGDDMVRRYPSLFTGVVAVPPPLIRRNMVSRINEEDTMRPTEVEDSLRTQRVYVEQMEALGKIIVTSFDDITVPGIYVAAPGTGKSTAVRRNEAGPITVLRDGVFEELSWVEWVHTEWLDPEQLAESRQLEERLGRGLWMAWVRGDIEKIFSPPVVIGFKPEFVSVVHKDFVRDAWAQLTRRKKISRGEIVAAAYSAEVATSECVGKHVIRVG